MQQFWEGVDWIWLKLASVKLTIFVLFSLLLLSIPGTIILQNNISNIDPGIQYDYDFWKFGTLTQLFTAYHSFWYVGLIILLSINLIACSVERWPMMLKLATVKPKVWADETFQAQADFFREWKSKLNKEAALKKIESVLNQKKRKFSVIDNQAHTFQVFWQTGRWSRIANYLVHVSLLVVFLGAIVSSLYGFEGAANIPAGSAVDSFIIFKEGKESGLMPAPGGLVNERMLGFRVQAESFNVSFYDNFPGRPKEFVSKLNIIDRGQVMKSAEIRVNDPLVYRNFTFYQASYGRMGDFNLDIRVIGKDHPMDNQHFFKAHLGEVQKVDALKLQFVPVFAVMNLQNLGPAVQFQEVKEGKPAGKPFWVLKDYPEFDFRRKVDYGVVVDEIKELYFTGLQIGYDPGAPIYWFGCFGMLLGTFYALFVTHKKYQLKYEKGIFKFAGSIHRLPSGFEKKVDYWTHIFQEATK